MHKTNFTIVLLTPVVGLALLTGCASEASHVRDTYGDAVRQMVDAQIYDRAAAANPGDAPVSLDGKKGELILKKHREDVPAAKDIQAPIVIGTTGQ